MSSVRARGFLWLAVAGAVLSCHLSGWAQSTPPANASSADSLNESVQELRRQVQDLQAAVAEVRSEAQQYRAETIELRRELETIRGGRADTRDIGAVTASDSVSVGQGAADQGVGQTQTSEQSHSANLEEEYRLLSGKIDDQYQTKVESASKYRVRLSGIVLLNLFNSLGTVDNIDLPSLAYDNPHGSSGGNFGGTLRQSQIGFEVFGPRLAGARSKADLQLDFGGGFPTINNGVNYGLVRLRTGTMRLDWENTSIVAGQDNLFFSPESPTSFASLIQPALSYSGNLWGWIPQVHVEHRIALTDDSRLLLQGGILDPLSGDPIYNYYRPPQAGESSRQPAYATRIGWTRTRSGQPLRIGVGGYYSRQDYGFDRKVDSWAAMADLDVPLSRRFAVSGEVYRGRAIGGLGGGIGRSVLFNGDPGSAATLVRPINDVGGWSQLTFHANSKVDFNAAVGLDNPYSADIHAFGPNGQAYGDPTLIKNQGAFFNVIYRPRSDLLFSAEYHRLKTFQLDNGGYRADHINLMMGVLF
jgi:hypothetical protein